MAYQAIENYGIIGNMRTTAHVGINGSIDWFCFPHFDSPSIFAAILDDQKGGNFQIAPATDGFTSKQFYWPDTNILVTRFYSPAFMAELIDYMPAGEAVKEHGRHEIVRRVNVVHGLLPFRLYCKPAFNYARDQHTVEIAGQGANFHSANQSMRLISKFPLIPHPDGAVSAEFVLHEGETATFLFHQIKPGEGPIHYTEDSAHEHFKKTVDYWRHWISKCTYRGRWRDMVHRSALVLKLLTFEPTGAIVAAPTCSLPEAVGGPRNWDYRYTWIRDAAFTLYGLLRIGFVQEVDHFMHWLESAFHDLKPDEPLQVMYGIDGRRKLMEEELNHLDGYKGSKPVRIGNGAYDQLQLDIHGELMDSVYLYNKYGAQISYNLWRRLRNLVNWVCDNWQWKDEGIWETRGGRQHFVYSKLMCWVAVDRALRLADKRSFPADRSRWVIVRDQIYEELMSKGWDRNIQSFVQCHGSQTLDASVLIMPLVFFTAPTDPRMLKTIHAINRTPSEGGLVTNGLVYRYSLQHYEDGLSGNEGTFNMCTFWLVEALTRAGKEHKTYLEQGRLIFEKMMTFSNHLGLFAEETGLGGEALGNFPQAFTHLSLISAAFNLDRALGGQD
jgi:GH15 family glucan-1,4-alpha-glucosidase